jgi:hypothetical protein
LKEDGKGFYTFSLCLELYCLQFRQLESRILRRLLGSQTEEVKEG